MFDFSNFLNLPLIFGFVVALAIFMYVFLDGFDLGIGILFPFAPSDDCRSKMMNSIAPFWDGNETWLILGGGAVLAAFPIAFAKIMPAFYIPIIMMLLGLIFRGVAFEFRFKTHSQKEQRIWDYSFHFGSLIATFFQGVMLGAFIQGHITTDSAFSWFSGFSIFCGIALIFGYALLGATWLIAKTEDFTQEWSYKVALYALAFVSFAILFVSIWTPSLHEEIFNRWFTKPNIFYLLPIPVITALCFYFLAKGLIEKHEKTPFIFTTAIFALCYLGLGISLFPYAVPFELTFIEAAASTKSLSLIFVGVAITLPVILFYTAYSYRVFRGKSSAERMY